MPRMAGREKVFAAAAALHLAIAALYAPNAELERYLPEALDRALSVYGGLSGARSRFDFFAPGVSNQARADFLVIPDNGPSRRIRLATSNAEANRRLNLMFTVFAYPGERERLMKAWADYILRLHPEAVAVEARVEMLEVPTMRESAAGKQPSWVEIGRTTVRRGEAPGR